MVDIEHRARLRAAIKAYASKTDDPDTDSAYVFDGPNDGAKIIAEFIRTETI